MFLICRQFFLIEKICDELYLNDVIGIDFLLRQSL
jgi:hypothetical protein